MEKQRWTSEGVLSYLRPLSTYTMYMKYPNDEDNRKKLSRIPNQIKFIEEAINSNDLSKDDMKILHDFYRENQESIDKVYLYAEKKNELENFKKIY